MKIYLLATKYLNQQITSIYFFLLCSAQVVTQFDLLPLQSYSTTVERIRAKRLQHWKTNKVFGCEEVSIKAKRALFCGH